MTFITTTPLRLKTQRSIEVFQPGDTFTPKKIEAVRGLIESGKVRPASPCHICHEYRWWLSTHGVLICGYCHPPASKELVKTWVCNEQIKKIA